MFKRTWNSPHFLSRTASHSTKGKRGGRVDVLPPNASDALFDITAQMEDGAREIERLNKERAEVQHEIHNLSGLDRFRARHDHGRRRGSIDAKGEELSARLAEIERQIRHRRAHIGELRAMLGGAHKLSFEEAFVRIAAAELSQDVYRAIETKASLIARMHGEKK